MVLNKVKIKDNQKGQSTVEFLLGFTLIFSILIVLLKVSVTYVDGYYQHYVTYMASRVFLTHESNDAVNAVSANYTKSVAKARKLFERYQVDKIIDGHSGQVNFNTPDDVARGIMVGAFSEFKRPLSPLRMFGGGEEVNYRSESFIGKEPPRGYCLNQLIQVMKSNPNYNSNHVTFYDNGC